MHVGNVTGNRDKYKEHLNWYLIMISFAPFWWRFWQCVHKAKKSKNYWQLVNAAKYASKWGPIISIYVFEESNSFYDENGNFTSRYWGYFIAQVLTTVFCLYWDYVWDWGLLYGKTNRILREKMIFSPNFYYMAMIENAMFRFWWLFASAHIQFGGADFWMDRIEILAMLGVMIELSRRMIWAVIRVENEQLNNLEQYRDILAIPPIKDDYDDK